MYASYDLYGFVILTIVDISSMRELAVEIIEVVLSGNFVHGKTVYAYTKQPLIG